MSIEALQRSVEESEQKKKAGCLRKLAKGQPPVMTRRANVLVSNEPCADRVGFRAAVNANLNLEITLHVVPTI